MFDISYCTFREQDVWNDFLFLSAIRVKPFNPIPGVYWPPPQMSLFVIFRVDPSLHLNIRLAKIWCENWVPYFSKFVNIFH